MSYRQQASKILAAAISSCPASLSHQLSSLHFICRAKFIVGSVGMLMGKQEGGATWLQGLRDVPYLEASEALCSLPGVGPKVSFPFAMNGCCMSC